VLVVVVGVGEGEGEAAGVGVGTALALVEAVFPPQETSANAKARVTEQVRAIRQVRKAYLLKKKMLSIEIGLRQCTKQRVRLYYVEDLRLRD